MIHIYANINVNMYVNICMKTWIITKSAPKPWEQLNA